MAVHTGSSKQGQWGQQGQTPISHTRTRDIIRWENHLSPAFPQDYVRPELLKKTHDREDKWGDIFPCRPHLPILLI